MLPKPTKRNNHPPLSTNAVPRPALGLVGVSVRAAAQALAGWPIERVVDLYCDYDTDLAFPLACRPCQDWSQVLAQVSTAGLRPWQWLPVGGLDLQPDVWAAIDKSPQQVLGCSWETVRFCKSPALWSTALAQDYPHVLPIRQQPQYPSGQYPSGQSLSGRCPPGRWFLKSAWPLEFDPWVWQQACDGVLGSALFLATTDTVQWVGGSRLYVTSDYRYLGNVAQLAWPPQDDRAALESIVSCLQRSTHLSGLIGIDYIHNPQVWPLEINPRPTASVEVLAEHLGRNLFVEHLMACNAREGGLRALVTDPLSPPCPMSPLAAKRVLYNRSEPLFIAAGAFECLRTSSTYRPLSEFCAAWASPRSSAAVPSANSVDDLSGDLPVEVRLADIPWPQSSIPPYQPICTLLARVTADQILTLSGAELATATWRLLERIESWVLPQLRRPTSASDKLS